MNKKFIFVGNRSFVFEEMLKLNLKIVKIFAIKNSYFESFLKSHLIEHIVISNKKQLINEISNTEFNYLISNGCPYILPISELKASGCKQFINIHPSFLPDLRGADPLPAAIKFQKDSGATCHVMTDNIDCGDIIYQEKIDFSLDLDVGLLYQLSFEAERSVFRESYKRKFNPQKTQVSSNNDIYYTFNEHDLVIDFSKNAQLIAQQIKAFNNHSKGAYFNFHNAKIKVFDAEIVNSNYMDRLYYSNSENEVIFNYENKILIKKHNCFLKLKEIHGNISDISVGTVL